MQNSILKRSTPYLIFALVMLFAAATGLFFHHNNFRGLGGDALDCAQLARNIFRGEGFSTNLLSANAQLHSSVARGFNPDLSHAPLFPLFLGAIFSVAGERDGVMAAFSLVLYMVSAALLWVLARRLTNNLILTVATVVAFALSVPVLGLADSGQPQALSGCFLLLALIALTPKQEEVPDEEERDDLFLEEEEGEHAFSETYPPTPTPGLSSERVENFGENHEDKNDLIESESGENDEIPDAELGLPSKNYLVAGLMAALCYLSDPLALIFLVPLCFLWGRGESGWKRPAVLAFLLGFVLLATPWWIRNLRLTGNPFYSQQWLGSSDQGGGAMNLAGNLKRGLGGFFYGVASIPHLYLMPFIVVAAWMSPRVASLARFKSATLITVVITVVVLSLLGHGETTQLLPLAPLLTLVGLMTFEQIVSDAREHRIQSGMNHQSISKSLLLFFLTVCNLRILKAEILARQSYQVQNTGEDGQETLDGGRWARSHVQQAQSLGLLLLILALPLILQRQQPDSINAREMLQPLSRLIPKERAIMTDVPQLVAWYNDRKVVSLPEQVVSLPQIDKNQKIGAIYLSGQSAAGSSMPNQWVQVLGRSLDIPGYQKITSPNARNLLYLKQPSVEETTQAVKAKPQSAAAYVALGESLLGKGQFTEALQAFNSAQRLQPKSSAGFLGAGKAQLSLRNETDAFTQFSKALQIQPRLTPALLGVAQISQTSGKTAQAISFYERVLADNPDNVIALNNLAQLYADQGNNLFRALEMARRAAAHNPENGSILDTLGWVCYRAGYRQEATTYLKRAAELSPENVTIKEHLQKAQLSTS